MKLPPKIDLEDLDRALNTPPPPGPEAYAPPAVRAAAEVQIGEAGERCAALVVSSFEQAARNVEDTIPPLEERLRQIKEEAAMVAGWMRQEGIKWGSNVMDCTTRLEAAAAALKDLRERFGMPGFVNRTGEPDAS